MARPSSYTEEVAVVLLDRLAAGESLTRICADSAMPDRVTVWRWKAADEAFCNRYLRAREDQAHSLMDEVIELADRATDKDDAAAIKVRVDARFKLAALMAPKEFGARSQVDLNVTGDLAGLIEEGRKRARGD